MQLKNILTFTGLAPGATASQPHGLTDGQRPLIPDELKLTSGTVSASADAINVTVTNNDVVSVTVLVLCEAWHSFERAFGNVANQALTPQPFVSGGGTSDSNAGGTGPIVSGMFHATATFDAMSNVVYSVEVLNLAGGLVYDGFDDHSADGYIQINLTLPISVAHHRRISLFSAHLVPPLPTNFLDGSPWLPLIVEEGASGTTVTILVPTNGKAPTVVPAVTTIGATYALWVAP